MSADAWRPRGIAEALVQDHARLDALAARAFACREARDGQGASEAWARFAAGLSRHIAFEEEVLFPLFEERTGMTSDAGPTAVMREEHTEIRGLLEKIAGEIAAPGPAADTLRSQLGYVLSEHNMKEEQMLYPEVDALAAPGESDALLLRLEEYGAGAVSRGR